MLVCRNKVTGIIDQISAEKAKANGGWWVLEEGDPLLSVAPENLKQGENVWTPVELTQAEKDAINLAEFNRLKPIIVESITQNAIRAVTSKETDAMQKLYFMGLCKQADKDRIDLNKLNAMSQAIAKYAQVDLIPVGDVAALKAFDMTIEI